MNDLSTTEVSPDAAPEAPAAPAATVSATPDAAAPQETKPAVPTALEPAFQFRGGTFNLMTLRILDAEPVRLFNQIEAKLAQSPNFFRNAPVVLDLEAIGPEGGVHLPTVVRRLRSLGLVPVGVLASQGQARDQQLAFGLPYLAGGRPPRVEQPEPAAKPADETAPESNRPAETPASGATQRAPTLFVTEPVRSGRQVYAAGGPMVVLAAVSPGAEVVADGDIHIYGPLRGRAIAGLSGDAQARIFCQSLEAEMVSVAGHYRVNEDIDRSLQRKPAQIFLQDGTLCMGALS